MSSHESLYDVKNGCVILRATKNSVDANDTAKYITGGIYTKGKQSFGYGKIEIRAKYTSAQGYWPALWLMPDKEMQWPYGGEIDIMEHLNFDTIVYQTVHTPFTRNKEYKQPIQNSHKTTINPNEFNIYGVERYRDSIVFFVNRERAMSYPKIDSLSHSEQFPFNKSNFYLLMDSQLGGAWVGDINPSHLPAELLIDWVRYYEPKNKR